ncbi:diguanylate cyclase domain-containing protein [Sphingomonas pseudosanguinis]|uniref:diguanylate cyclase n=1 Tax=Sphingomonas pseudosanguinis TaxID=413712 RepID=A0A7W6A6X2_9SPHN|nr:diguanylate cyclase (GGDEF)-like protein [Sphingomonas pseudosanguinis]MBN3538125.1 diguanylate cyclase [Sphingomonas pseudosanguinis]
MRYGIGALILAIFVALLPLAPARADKGDVLRGCIRPIQPGDTPHALFLAPQRFDCAHDQSDYGAGDFWILSDPLPVLPGDPRERLAVTFASTWQDATTLHILYADGSIRDVAYTSATTAPYLLLGAVIAVPLPRATTRPVRILWEAHGAANMRGVVRGAHLVHHADALAVESSLSLVYGIIMGLVVGLAVYNLALWPALRQPLQPVYCMLLFFITGYALCSSGLIGQWLPWLDNNERHRWNAIMLGGVALTLVIFARHFFERKVFEGWLDRWAIVTFVLIAIPNAAFALLAPRWIRPLDTAVVIGFLVLLVFLIAVLVSAWRRRSNFLWAFAIAWGTPIILAMFRVLHALHLIQWRPWIDQSTLLSMGAEALIASLGVAYRIYLLSRERDQARAHERAARRLADTDPLTGLFNRRALLDQAVGRSGPQTLILADIDHFKRINDTLGHDEGDEVLRGFAQALIDTLPPGTLAARIGGEEFALLADADHAPDAEVLLKRLRTATYPAGLKVTASLGLCSGLLQDEEDWRRLYREADQALFAAKNGGRDRACWAPELHVPTPPLPVIAPLVRHHATP